LLAQKGVELFFGLAHAFEPQVTRRGR
jgi:hypothetical protein